MSNSDGYETAKIATPSNISTALQNTKIEINVSDEETNLEPDYETGAEMVTTTDGEETDDDEDAEEESVEIDNNKFDEHETENSLAATETSLTREHGTKATVVGSYEQTDDETESVVKEEIEDFTLIINLFKLCELADNIRGIDSKKEDTSMKLALEFSVGKSKVLSTFQPAADENVNFNEELRLPFSIPNNIKYLRLRIIRKKGLLHSKRILCTAFLSLDQISHQGEHAFFHNFGPAFINFYGPSQIRLKSSIWRQRKMRKTCTGVYQGDTFFGRVFLSLIGDESENRGKRAKASQRPMNAFIPDMGFNRSYALFCSFYAANMIHPDLKSKNIYFEVSVGEYGSEHFRDVPKNSNRTLAVMPSYDTMKYYAMPWGNHKPVCEILSTWEEITHRVGQSNAIIKIVREFIKHREEALISAGSLMSNRSLEAFEAIVKKAYDSFKSTLNQLKEKHAYDLCKDTANITELDFLIEELRFDALDQIKNKFEALIIDQKLDSDLFAQELAYYVRSLKDLAMDPQISIPNVVIKMFANKELVAFKRLCTSDIFYNKDAELLSGKYCNKINSIPLQWLPTNNSLNKKNELPCILHLKLWFGLSKERRFFKKSLIPGQIKYYAEIFHNQHRTFLRDKWSDTKNKPPTISDELGEIALTKEHIKPPLDWNYKGEWVNKRSHDMWIGPDAGRIVQQDEYFELEIKNNKAMSWESLNKTSYYGDVLDKEQLKYPPPGWEYIDSYWSVDFLCPGDAEGWIYSKHNDFWNKKAVLDTVERETHVYRRRRLKKMRRRIDQEHTLDLNNTNLFDKSGWEYATSFNQPLHTQQLRDDKFRRRRKVCEMVCKTKTDSYRLVMGYQQANTSPNDAIQQSISLSPRIYEVYDQVSSFQLRVYVLWARELFMPESPYNSTFVRVFFLNNCQETLVAANAINPVWNETLIISNLFVAGGIASLQKNPPSIIYEVGGKGRFGSELFLGRFHATPTVISSPINLRAKTKWFPLQFRNDQTRGSLLVGSELFQADPAMISKLPKLPNKKGKLKDRYEIPSEILPEFRDYSVQFLCWGVRDLPRYKLFRVQSPFVEFTVGNRTETSDIIQNASKNPNFEFPLISLEKVTMPKLVYYAPPITMNLHDKRSFGRKPLVGTAYINNFSKFLQKQDAKPNISYREDNWAEYDSEMLTEDELLRKDIFNFDFSKRGEVQIVYEEGRMVKTKIDWWSKYYFSIGNERKAPGYKDSGMEKLLIFSMPLESVNNYNEFDDFLDTFVFHKPNNKDPNSSIKKVEAGELKGKFFIFPLYKNEEVYLTLPPGIEFSGVVPCVLRVYIIRAYQLKSRRNSARCDPYISIRCGAKKKINGKKDYVPDTLEPLFGQFFELEINIPQDRHLVISVMDNRRILLDKEVGSTIIDLENRLLTSYRATVGLPKQFNVFGPLPWRDQLTPLQTLRRYCIKMRYPPPKLLRSSEQLNKEVVVGMEFLEKKYLLSEIEPTKPVNEEMLGNPLQRLALFILNELQLVPEHIETRPIFNQNDPTNEVGRLEMFVDLFPRPLGAIPPPLNIRARKPISYQLRVVVWNVRNAILRKRSMGQPAADLYVKCYMNGADKAERTDIHYRCLDGAAAYNWRFVVDFDYDIFEEMLSVKRKGRLFRKKTVELVEPILIIQLWDNNKFKKDGLIGEYQMNLLGFEEGQMFDDEMANIRYSEENNFGCCGNCALGFLYCYRLCSSWCCGRKTSKAKKLISLPRAPLYVPGKVGTSSIFQKKSTYGWWPCLSGDLLPEQKDPHKKNDDFDANAEYVTGLVELEIDLLTAAEAKHDPVGRKRNKPNHSPFLPKPDRPKMDSYWCTSRLTAFSRICWNKCGCQSLCFCILLALLVLFIIAAVWQSPSIFSQFFFNSK